MVLQIVPYRWTSDWWLNAHAPIPILFVQMATRATTKCVDECQNAVSFFFFWWFTMPACHVIFFGIKCLSHFIRQLFNFFARLLSLVFCVCMQCAYVCVMCFMPKLNGNSVCFVCCHLENECKFGHPLRVYTDICMEVHNRLNLTRWNLIF